MKKYYLKSIIAISVVIFVGSSLFAYLWYQKKIHRPDLTVVGFVNEADGVGRQSIELIDAFKDELSIGFLSTRVNKFTGVSSALKKIVETSRDRLGKVIVFEDVLWWPNEEKFQQINVPEANDSIKIAYSMVESTRIPQEWVIILNELFDAVAVPDSFLVEVYQDSGVKIPVFELPLGRDLSDLLAQSLKTRKSRPFVFANLSVCSDRKNQLLLIRAFAKAFGDNPNVFLRINSRYGEKEVSHAITKEIAELGLNNIQFTQFCLDKEDYIDLFKNVDCYVSISKGEGFSIQPREAMALGIPVIATDNTAQSTICKSGLVKVVDSPQREAAAYPWGCCYGYAFNCQLQDVVDSLKDVYNNYDDYLDLAPAARAWASQYQFENLRPLYKSLIKPKRVVLGEINKIEEDCLTTNSIELFDKYNWLFGDELAEQEYLCQYEN